MGVILERPGKTSEHHAYLLQRSKDETVHSRESFPRVRCWSVGERKAVC